MTRIESRLRAIRRLADELYGEIDDGDFHNEVANEPGVQMAVSDIIDAVDAAIARVRPK